MFWEPPNLFGLEKLGPGEGMSERGEDLPRPASEKKRGATHNQGRATPAEEGGARGGGGVGIFETSCLTVMCQPWYSNLICFRTVSRSKSKRGRLQLTHKLTLLPKYSPWTTEFLQAVPISYTQCNKVLHKTVSMIHSN